MNRQEIYAIGFPAKNAYMPFIDFVLDYATHDDKILDLGGGEGAYSAELIKRGFNCINVDLNREYILCSRARGVDSLWLINIALRLFLYSSRYTRSALALANWGAILII